MALQLSQRRGTAHFGTNLSVPEHNISQLFIFDVHYLSALIRIKPGAHALVSDVGSHKWYRLLSMYFIYWFPNVFGGKFLNCCKSTVAESISGRWRRISHPSADSIMALRILASAWQPAITRHQKHCVRGRTNLSSLQGRQSNHLAKD